MNKRELKRCVWGNVTPLMQEYHDKEWGVPVYNDRKIFEFLTLEAAQAGLSWSTVLNKRENYRKNFERFDPKKVAKFSKVRIEKLLKDPGIIRNRLKVEAAVNNAKCFLRIQKEYGTFSKYIWSFVGGKPIQNKWKKMSDLPAVTKEAEELSKDLKLRGFKFIGPTIIYAHMQAAGMVNDHTVDCFRYRQVNALT